MKKLKQSLIAILVTIITTLGFFPLQAFADMDFSVSPMTQRIVLSPGEDYSGTFEVINPSYSPGTFYYKLSVEPFSVNEKYEPVFENNGDYNQIVDWVEFENEKGSIEPNETARVNFTVHTPETAPAGGQYAIIRVTSDYDMNLSENDNSLNIQNVMSIAHVLYAEVAGETERSGEILEAKVPSFLFSGNISGTATIKNTGNVHSDGTYTLQIFPFFSKEEIYTNEESPKTNIILPDTTRTTTVKWEETPKLGIFHVIYTVEFEGSESTVDKYVIICPLWLLLVVLVCLFVVIFSIVFEKKRKEDR